MRIRRSVPWALLAVLAAGCATQRESASPDAPAAKDAVASASPKGRAWENWPPQSATAAQPAPYRSFAGPLRIEPKDGGWRVPELLEMISKAEGVPVYFDSSNATLKQTKVEFQSPIDVPAGGALGWLQSVLSYRKLVLVPLGPRSADGRSGWALLDQADPSMKSRPVFVAEEDLAAYADRDGLYVVTAFRVRDTVDTTRLRNALSPLSTAVAGIGRITDVPDRWLVVGDFAPVVALMKNLVDFVNTQSSPPAGE